MPLVGSMGSCQLQTISVCSIGGLASTVLKLLWKTECAALKGNDIHFLTRTVSAGPYRKGVMPLVSSAGQVVGPGACSIACGGPMNQVGTCRPACANCSCCRVVWNPTVLPWPSQEAATQGHGFWTSISPRGTCCSRCRVKSEAAPASWDGHEGTAGCAKTCSWLTSSVLHGASWRWQGMMGPSCCHGQQCVQRGASAGDSANWPVVALVTT